MSTNSLQLIYNDMEKIEENLKKELPEQNYTTELCSDMMKEFKRQMNFETPPPKLRIASWNLEEFKGAKIEKIKSISLTIYKNDFHLIAFQEVMQVEGIEKVRDELRRMSGSKWECWFTYISIGKGLRGNEYGAFLWNSSVGLAMQPASSEEEKLRAVVSLVANGAETDATKVIKTALQKKVKVEEKIKKKQIVLMTKAAEDAASQLPDYAQEEFKQALTKSSESSLPENFSQGLQDRLEEHTGFIIEEMEKQFEPNNIKKKAESALKEVISLHTISLTDNPFSRKPVFGKFQISLNGKKNVTEQWNFTLINFHLKPNKSKMNNNDEEVKAIDKVFDFFSDENEDIILLGDFNADIDCDRHTKLKELEYFNPFKEKKTNYKGDECYDAIVVTNKHRSVVPVVATTYASSVYQVSNHCPIYADFDISGN